MQVRSPQLPSPYPVRLSSHRLDLLRMLRGRFQQLILYTPLLRPPCWGFPGPQAGPSNDASDRQQWLRDQEPDPGWGTGGNLGTGAAEHWEGEYTIFFFFLNIVDHFLHLQITGKSKDLSAVLYFPPLKSRRSISMLKISSVRMRFVFRSHGLCCYCDPFTQRK